VNVDEKEFVNEYYEKLKKHVTDDREWYFHLLAKHEEVQWAKPYSKVLDSTKAPLHRWFPDGEINMCYNAIDKHVERGHGDNVAFIFDSAYLNI
jgi:propionyl-CoA synthetase